MPLIKAKKVFISILLLTGALFIANASSVKVEKTHSEKYCGHTSFESQSPPPCEAVFDSVFASSCGNYIFNNSTYSLSGIYYDTLQKYDGCDSIIVLILSIFPMPVADFSINQYSQCYDEQNFVFTDNSSLSGDVFLNKYWVINNDTFFNKKTYSPKLPEPGIYEIDLYVITSHQCRDSIKKYFSVRPSPDAYFTVNDTIQCENDNLFIFKVRQKNLQYYWHFGDDKVCYTKDSVVMHHYENDGVKVVMLIAVNDSGCTNIVSRTIKIHPAPRAKFKITSDTAQCLSGNYFSFSNETTISDGIIYYNWNWGDYTTCPDPLPTHTYYFDSVFTIRLIAVSDKKCSESTEKKVIVYPDPVMDFTYSTLCPEKEIRFYSKCTIKPGYQIVSWFWDFGYGNVTSQNKDPNFLYLSPGEYPVIHQAISDRGCTAEIIKTLKIPGKTHQNEIVRATIIDQKPLIEWLPPDSGLVKSFTLEKSVNGNDFKPFKILNANVFSAYDDSCDVNKTSYYYRISLTDSCNNIVLSKNVGKPVLLQTDTNEALNLLKWTAYQSWPWGVSSYQVEVAPCSSPACVSYISENEFIPIGFVSPAANPGIDYSFRDNLSQFDADYYCYRIIAMRNPDQLESASNIVCTPTPFRLFIPNSFTPNGDNLNEVFLPVGAFITEFQLIIFNSWGEKVFESNRLNEGWDGTLSGNPCQDGIYYYHLTAKGTNGIAKYYYGTISLLR